jgi:hypothetical protein
LAWVSDVTPGIRYQLGNPGRAASGVGWSGDMPTDFGSSTIAGAIYSIYATYSGGGGGCTLDSQCEDGLWCNGTDTCSGGACTHQYSGNERCDPDTCNESTDTCDEGGFGCLSLDPSGTTTGNSDSSSNDWYGYGRYSGCNNHADDAAVDVCFSWTPTISGTYILDACGSESEYDTVLSVHTADGQTMLDCNDDADSYCPNDQSRLSFDATANTDYIIVIDGYYPSDSGDYELVITPPAGSCTDNSQCNDSNPCTDRSLVQWHRHLFGWSLYPSILGQ